ncbi:hypothetical protein, conserved [Entamoeba dispar SAW760]|uniref:Rab-GAP TBC domain-containing protein n=1 Tax=Entamoeba dispar (strain ATCC PRA-260 / SAW760) TaxID=370354 RepID=B0E6T4_ENTDS|nr:uncharacterized protein EDI_315420 [Entamoeba dispar SAW760]EDR29765.1 hypothetical protein, conserved [Entamoeba dispar SAW760]|eukprot:EDR29765.1 hypothetical protein, conserved [Entamoeba dispar SAW760]
MKLFRRKENNILQKLLLPEIIEINKIRQAVFQYGISGDNEEDSRSIVWKLLLNVYSCQKHTWEETDNLLHKDYLTFLKDFFPNQKINVTDETTDADQLLLYEIDKDVKRLFPKSPFFLEEKNRECIRHILYVQTKFNKTYPYVQGMNDIAGVLFYVFAQSTSRARAESTTYYCFAYLMTKISDWYSPKLDWTSRGIHAQLARIDAVLAMKEPELYEHLVLLNITNTLYSFRWVTLLFAQEFPIESVLLVWDCILVDPTGDFICCLCVSMLVEIKRQLLNGDFSYCLKTLQKYPPSANVHNIIKRARSFYTERASFPPLVEPTTV